MFDEIHYKGRVWQTKDFECCMDHYHIREGRLYLEKVHWCTDADGHFRPIKTGEVEVPFHGVIEICDWDPKDTRSIQEGRELERRTLKFTDGKLVSEALIL